MQCEDVSAIPSGTCQGRFQQAHPGSYAVIEDSGLEVGDDGLDISFYLQPTLLNAGHDQTVISLADVELPKGVTILIGKDGLLRVRVGDGEFWHETIVDHLLFRQQWIKVNVRVHKKAVNLTIDPILRLGQKKGVFFEHQAQVSEAVAFSNSLRLTIAATQPREGVKATDFFNGRVEGVRLSALRTDVPHLIVDLDFSRKISTDEAIDVSGHGRHGVLINAPSRAVTGHDWDGSETDWTKATYGYGAIHFHEDDLDDARWATDFTIRIPAEARSGAYAVEVLSTEDRSVGDNIVFFVRPSPSSTAGLALVLSTFTYTAYANEHMYDESKSSQLALLEQPRPKDDENFARMKRRTDLGLSLYDVHSDGSGSIFSTTKRPILNIRPGFQHWAFHRPREFSADLLMIGFLEKLGIPYDVLTDHDLHDTGVRGLAQYNTLLTGSHPEYPTLRSLDAYSNFAAQGGNICYLGGNGFYWLSVLDERNPHRLEVRRGDQGVRTFGLPGGERHHALNGAQGGLWRSRGRPANHLFGVGCCGEGSGDGVPYSRAAAPKHQPSTPEIAAARAKYDWVFEGLGPDELIGTQGFGGGASGDEIDRWDSAHGSPHNAIILASSTGHPDRFGLFPEEYGFQETAILGTQTDKIRSDIVMYPTPSGGYIFSVGSMNWYCSLGWDNYKTSVARVTENILRRFTGGHDDVDSQPKQYS